MGMDVFGTNPTDETGKYFRNNVWWWRPLASFLIETYPDLTSACTYWGSNDGDGLNASASAKLAEAVQRDIDNGAVAQYETEYTARLQVLPMEVCDWCDGTGVRTDEVGRRNGLDVPRDAVTGKGGCNACNGVGKIPHWDTSYPFSVENVQNFTNFLRTCGGFRIC